MDKYIKCVYGLIEKFQNNKIISLINLNQNFIFFVVIKDLFIDKRINLFCLWVNTIERESAKKNIHRNTHLIL